MVVVPGIKAFLDFPYLEEFQKYLTRFIRVSVILPLFFHVLMKFLYLEKI